MKRSLTSKSRDRLWLVPCLIALAGCSAATDNKHPTGPDGSSGTGTVGASGSSGTGDSTSGTGSSNAGTTSNGTGGLDGSAGGPPAVCPTGPTAARAPMRRLTQFEYNNTLKDLGLDSTDLAINLPSEDLSNGFGNDADSQSASSELIKQYAAIAEGIDAQVTTPAALATRLPCAATVTTATEPACARTFVEGFGPKIFRRPLATGEADSFLTLFTTIRAASGSTFASSIGAIVEAMVQDPSFLYRPEFGVPVDGHPELLRPTGSEMATRLSYLLWGSTPDDTLRAAAAAGELDTPAGITSRATQMLTDLRAHTQVRFFFDNLLPISSLNQLTRDATLYPAYTSKLGSLMRQETETFLDHLVFDDPTGSWPSAFTANYTYVNQDLAAFYGMTGVTGTAFVKVPVDPVKRLGLLSQAGIVAGTIHSNETNPVVRGGFVVRKLLCQSIPLPTGAIAAMVMIPAADMNKTARERYTAHSASPICHSCHVNMDPVGFAFENFDPIGQWRDKENGVMIDATGTAQALGTFTGPADLGHRVAESEAAQQCFASNWVNYGYGRTITPVSSDACVVTSVATKFKDSGYSIQKLLLSLTASDAFLYLPAVRE